MRGIRPRGQRWEKAKADSHGWVFKREVGSALICGLLGVGAARLTGDTGVSIVGAVFVAASAVLGVLLLPPLELAWNYLKAPRRLLTESVASLADEIKDLRQQLADLADDVRQPATRARIVNVRLTVMSLIRSGKEIEMTPALGPYSQEHRKANAWASTVMRTLSRLVSADVAEGFLNASEATGHAALGRQIEFLESLVDRGELPAELEVPANE